VPFLSKKIEYQTKIDIVYDDVEKGLLGDMID